MAYNGLTNAGAAYLAARQANNLPVEFLKAKVGNGIVPSGTDPAELTDIISEKMEIEITGVQQVERALKMIVQVSNESLTTGFYLTEIAIYVNDNGTPVLYWYIGKDNGTYVPDSTKPMKYKNILNIEVSSTPITTVNYTGKDLWIDEERLNIELDKKVDKATYTETIEYLRNNKLDKGTYSGTASDLDTDIKKCVSGQNITGSIDISISDPGLLTATKFYRMDGSSPFHPMSGLGTMAGVHIQHPTVNNNGVEIQIPFDGTSRMFVKNSVGVQEVARTGGLNKTLNDVNVDLTTLSGNFTNFKTTVESNYISGINESGTGNKKDTTLAGAKSGFYRWEGANMPIVDAVGLINVKHPSNESIGAFLAMTFTGEAKMWVGNTQWGFSELVNKSYLDVELVNSTAVRSTTGTYPLQNNLSSNYKFINMIFGDAAGGWRQYMKIPFADRRSEIVAYGVSSTTASETAIVSFPTDSSVSYAIQNLSGDNQACLYKVWQSNV